MLYHTYLSAAVWRASMIAGEKYRQCACVYMYICSIVTIHQHQFRDVQ